MRVKVVTTLSAVGLCASFLLVMHQHHSLRVHSLEWTPFELRMFVGICITILFGAAYIWRQHTKFLFEKLYKKNIEKQLVINNKLCIIGEISAGIAHEINNPLTIIKTQLDLMSLRKVCTMPEACQQTYDKINNAIDRAIEIVKTIKKHSQRFDDKNDPVNFHQAAQDAIALLENKAKKWGVKPINDLDPTLTITGNQTEIMQIFMNLISNAIDAVSNQEARFIAIKNIDAKNFIVEDNGPGVDKGKENRLFNQFFTTKRASGGTGLGLSLCQQIISNYKGTIEYKRENDLTKFIISFK